MHFMVITLGIKRLKVLDEFILILTTIAVVIVLLYKGVEVANKPKPEYAKTAIIRK
jgi:hypothetical protein